MCIVNPLDRSQIIADLDTLADNYYRHDDARETYDVLSNYAMALLGPDASYWDVDPVDRHCYSDCHKSLYGFRPRSFTTVDDVLAFFASYDDRMRQQEEEDRWAAEAATAQWVAGITNHLNCGASDVATAISWDMQAYEVELHDQDPVSMYAYLLGLPHMKDMAQLITHFNQQAQAPAALAA